MSKLALWQQDLPERYEPPRQLIQHLSQMEFTQQIATIVATVGSDMYAYSVWKMFMTVREAEQLRLMHVGGMPWYVEERYHDLTRDYIDFMRQIPQEVSARLLDLLRWIPQDVEDASSFATVRALLGG